MANVVNRNLDGPPRQGRRRECERRLRQQARARDRRLVEALDALPVETVEALRHLGDAEAGYLEQAIEDEDLRRDYARAVLRAFDVPEKVAMDEDTVRVGRSVRP